MLFSLAVVVATLAGSIPAVVRQYRTDRPGFWKTLRLFAVYLAYVFAGLGMLLLLLRGPQPPAAAVAGTIFVLAWILYGSLWLTRGVPRYRERPAWIDTYPSALDYAFWAIIAGALAAALLI